MSAMSDVYDVEVSIKINGTNHISCIAVSQVLWLGFEIKVKIATM